MRRSPLIISSLVVLALVAGCGDDGGDDVSTSDSTDSTAAPVGPVTAAADDPLLDTVTVNGRPGEAPTLEFEQPFEATETVRRVLDEGDGDVLEIGMNVSFHDVMVNGSDGLEIDNSYAAEQAPSIVMDEAQIIPGLIRGLLGVPVGSRVLVAMAPVDAFQSQGGIPDAGVDPDDSILFVADILSASIPLERAEGTPVEPEEGLPTVELDDTGKPTITVPDDDPPSELVAQPLIEGEGAVVEEGQTISVHYTGVIWPGGEQFDSSWDTGEPASFAIGVGAVIPGWDEGLVGRTIGTQMLLVVPPDQGYGPEGNAQAGIEGTDTLVFVVDILGVA